MGTMKLSLVYYCCEMLGACAPGQCLPRIMEDITFPFSASILGVGFLDESEDPVPHRPTLL